MNLINKIIILIILLIIINSLTDGQIILKLKNIFKSSIIKYINKEKNNQLNLKNFTNKNNIIFTKLKQNNVEGNKILINKLQDYLNKNLNCDDHKFNNIEILDSIFYDVYLEGLKFKPFRIKTSINLNNENLGIYIILIECSFENKNKSFVLNNINILIHKYPNNIFIKNNKEKKIEIENEIDNENDIDTENSLIPSAIDLSNNEYESSSE